MKSLSPLLINSSLTLLSFTFPMGEGLDFFAAKRSPKETERSRSWTVRDCPRTCPSQEKTISLFFGVE